MLSFSVRTMLLVMVVFAVWIGWLAQSARDQERTVAAIERLDGVVGYDWDTFPFPGESRTSAAQSLVTRTTHTQPQWLRRLLGRHCFDRVILVRMTRPCPEDTMIAIAKFKHLRNLDIHLDGWTDRAWQRLTALKKLRYLGIDHDALTNERIEVLQRMTHLRRLRIRRGVTDANVAALKRLTHLETLTLYDCDICHASELELRRAMPNTEIHLGWTQYPKHVHY